MAVESRTVWDLPTRLFHWLLVVLIVLQYASGEFGLLSLEWHFWLGYATLALILFRIVWGFVGSQTSRFGDFLRGPAGTLRYAGALLRGQAPHRRGHNPLGGWSVIALLLSVGLQAVSGLFTSDDISEEGPLAGRVSGDTVDLMNTIHAVNRYVLIALIGLHILAVLYHRFVVKHDLVKPMFTGRDRIEADSAPRIAPLWWAALVAVLAAAAVWGVVTYGPTGG